MANTSKQKYEVTITGCTLSLVSDDPKEYVDALAKTLNDRISLIRTSNRNLSATDAALFCAMDYLDTVAKSKRQSDAAAADCADKIRTAKVEADARVAAAEAESDRRLHAMSADCDAKVKAAEDDRDAKVKALTEDYENKLKAVTASFEAYKAQTKDSLAEYEELRKITGK